MAGELFVDELKVSQVLLGDPDAMVEVSVSLALLSQCSTGLDQVGAPPTWRLKSVIAPLRRACGLFEGAANDIARGIDTFDPEKIEKGASKMERASAHINKSTQRFNALSDRISG